MVSVGWPLLRLSHGSASPVAAKAPKNGPRMFVLPIATSSCDALIL